MNNVEILLYYIKICIVPYVVDIYIRNLIHGIILQHLRIICMLSYVIVPYIVHIRIRTLIISIKLHQLRRLYTHLCYSTVCRNHIHT